MIDILQYPSTRDDALSGGFRYYIHDKPCKHGHSPVRSAKTGKCRMCDVLRGRKRISTETGKEENRRRSLAARARPEYREKLYRAQGRYFQTPKGRAAIRRCQSKRRAAKIGAVPAWADQTALNRFVESCPPGFHIDHIIPLQGTNVCGLHDISNLQYLSVAENLSKSNKIDPLTLEANICVLPEYRSYIKTPY